MDLRGRIAEAVTIRAVMKGRESCPADGPGIDIGFGTDAAYVRPMGVSIVSLATGNPGLNLRVHVFASSIHVRDVACLEMLVQRYPHVEIRLYDVDARVFSGLPVLEKYPLPIYFRLMMPIVLADAPRVLYLDSDILCLDTLGPLVELDLRGNLAAAVPDTDRTSGKRIAALNLASGVYFNSGVMLIDVAGWNAERITERTLEMLAATPGRFLLPDQDVLNLLLEGRTLFLPRLWNFMMGRDERPEGVHLLHCAAHPKPWRIACDSLAQTYYLHFEAESPWAGDPLEQPVDYKEAKWYAKVLWRRWRLLAGTGWYLRSGAMKFHKKVIRRLFR